MTDPLIHSGQGRSPQAVTGSAFALIGCLLLALVVVAAAIINSA